MRCRKVILKSDLRWYILWKNRYGSEILYRFFFAVLTAENDIVFFIYNGQKGKNWNAYWYCVYIQNTIKQEERTMGYTTLNKDEKEEEKKVLIPSDKKYPSLKELGQFRFS